MTLTVTIPEFETERLILRAPRMEDHEAFLAFRASARTRYMGGPVSGRPAVRAMGHIAGLWVLRGYGCFVAESRETGRPVGMVGPWYPQDYPEMEFSWAIWDPACEGLGYVTEAMRVLIPWSWTRSGLSTAISVVDEGNEASHRVARRLGARLDGAATEAANRPGSPFHEEGAEPVRVWRHLAGAAA